MLRANQIARIASDFKVDVINNKMGGSGLKCIVIKSSLIWVTSERFSKVALVKSGKQAIQ